MSNWYDPGDGKHIIVDGAIVEIDALRIAEAIKAYDENLVLLCLDPNRAEGITDEPFVVAERGPDGILHPFLKAWELNENILHRIWQSDCHKFDGYDRLLKMEENAKKERTYRYQEVRDETKDVLAHLTGMKSSYVAENPATGQKIKFFDDRPAEKLGD